MGLRSRKAGADGDDARGMDMETQTRVRMDKPLEKLHIETEAFNMMWRDFLFKLTCVLVLYSSYALYAHIHLGEVVGFDLLSIGFYVLSVLWIKGLEGPTGKSFTHDRYFRMSMALMLSQVVYFAYEFSQKGKDIQMEFIPQTAIYTVIVLVALQFMTTNAKRIENTRIELHKQ
mmetsp:Transcript_19764/g.32472  ORF Transcript_19764/g.32472 Transcript_19764/m.32472 type:complete len:174 (-) Transcript_19764:187-708(-)